MQAALMCILAALLFGAGSLIVVKNNRSDWKQIVPQFTKDVQTYCSSNRLSSCEEYAYAWSEDAKAKGYDPRFVSYVPKSATAGHVVCMIEYNGSTILVEPQTCRKISSKDIFDGPHAITDKLRY